MLNSSRSFYVTAYWGTFWTQQNCVSSSVLFTDAVSGCDLMVSAVDEWGICRGTLTEENRK